MVPAKPPAHSLQNLLEWVSQPFALVSPTGEVLHSNRAFGDLLERCGARPHLAQLLPHQAEALLA